jgi:hypothetical protein
MDNLTFTDRHAEDAGRYLSRSVKRGLYLVVYPDAKNGRLVINLYTGTPDNVKRIARQIKVNKASVFENGARLDDSQFTGD